MAKFTSSIPLETEYEGHTLRGPAGTIFRLPDSLKSPFEEQFGTRIPITWVVEDEVGSVVGGESEHPDLASHLSIGVAAASVVSSHLTALDPHPNYALDTDLSDHESEGHVHQHAYSTLTGVPSTFAPATHSHVDGDLPAGLARDSEVTAAIAQHVSTATHGGGDGASLPAGLIVMWGGAVSAIPSGWLLCDGQNGTPDLSNRFIRGTTSAPGGTGGAATHTHAAHTGVINHTHPVVDPGHTHVENSNNATTGGLRGWGAADTSTNTSTATGFSTASSTTGVTTSNPSGGVSSLTHDSPDHLPPYYSLCFIQKQ